MTTKLFKRFVDDINMAPRRLGTAGIEDGEDLEEDERNMKMIAEEGNKIHRSIQVTYDCPSKHQDKKLRILDLKTWFQDKVEEGKARRYIVHEFYHKEVASKAVINARSAVPKKNIRTILTQEVVRILRNCSRRLPWDVVCRHIRDYSARMQYSGHSKRMRKQVVKSALNAYDRMIEKDERGEEPLYRHREWNRSKRLEDKRMKKERWFKGKDKKKESVIFVPATPHSILKRRYQEVIGKAKVEIAVVEVAGTSLKRMLQRSDPFKERKCEKEKSCMVCSGSARGRCREEGVTYKIECECGSSYYGETSRNAITRGQEHKSSLHRKDKSSPLVAHCMEEHGGRMKKFDMRVTGSFRNDAMKRQIAESIQIEQTKNGLINRRDEWRQVNLPHLRLA